MVNFQGLLVLGAMLLPVACAAMTAVAMLDANVRKAVALIALAAPYLVVSVSAVAILYAAGLAASDVARRWHSRSHVYPDASGMYPLVRTRGKRLDWFDATPESVKAVAAYTHALAAHGLRPTATATKAAFQGSLYGQPALPAPYGQPPVVAPAVVPDAPSASDPFDIDPTRSPHVLIVGKTGSGKSTLARHLLSRFTRRYPTEVIVCDPDGVNWLDQCSASSTDGIAAAVNAAHGEFARRQAILSDGGQPAWTYLILLLEETETVFERLAYVSDATEDLARFQLREIARMGRKAGVFLWSVTQVAAGDVFDLHVRRNMTVYCALSEPGVGRMLGVPKEIDLTRLAPGMVFASTTGAVMRFPSSTSVRLPLSPLFHEDSAQLVTSPVLSPVLAGSGPSELVTSPVLKLDPGRQPTPTEAAHMRQLHARGWSKNRIVVESYGYKNSDVFNYVNDALEGRL